jgi:hypothetical protein
LHRDDCINASFGYFYSQMFWTKISPDLLHGIIDPVVVDSIVFPKMMMGVDSHRNKTQSFNAR